MEVDKLNSKTDDFIVAENVIIVGNTELVVIYDPPHLLKGTRNNLLNKHLEIKLDSNTYYASWQIIEQAYEIDKADQHKYTGRHLNRITEQCIYPEHMKKMKVAYAARVFSATFAKYLALLKLRKGNIFVRFRERIF